MDNMINPMMMGMGAGTMPALQDQKGNLNLFGDLVICHTTQFGNGGMPGMANPMMIGMMQAMQQQLLEARQANTMLLSTIAASVPVKLAMKAAEIAAKGGQKALVMTDTGEVIEADVEERKNSIFKSMRDSQLGETSIRVAKKETPSYDLPGESIYAVEVEPVEVKESEPEPTPEPKQQETMDSFKHIEIRKSYWASLTYDPSWLDMSSAIDHKSMNFKFEILKTIDEFGRTPLYGGMEETNPVWMVSTEEDWRLSVAKAIKSYKSSVFKKTKFKEGVTPIIIFTFNMKTNDITMRYLHPFRNGGTPDAREFDTFFKWLSRDNPLYELAPRISLIQCYYVPHGQPTSTSDEIMVEIDNIYELDNNGKMGKIKLSSNNVEAVTRPMCAVGTFTM